MKVMRSLKTKFQNLYSDHDCPCLIDQLERFSKDKPFKGLKILHATPIFKNVIPKIMPLLASGADLDLSLPKDIPYDQEIINFLSASGVNFLKPENVRSSYDVILDCVGSFADLNSRYGSVELTKSGEEYYSNKKCISVDRSRIKLIEDKLGTSDGLIRALSENGIQLTSKKILIFGYGKVGSGAYDRLIEHTNEIAIVDLKKHASIQPHIILTSKKHEIISAIIEADIIITATGVKNIIENSYDITLFKNKVLINLGAEDEFGPSFNDSEVFNNKKPANFILEEPTRLTYLDATFALQSESIFTLIKKSEENFNLISPEVEIENYILNISTNKSVYV